MGRLPVTIKDPHQLHLEQVAVCKASGMLPTRYCRDTEQTWFIPGKSPIRTDTVFREVAIDKTTGLRTCHVTDNTRFEIYEFWSSDLLKIFKEAGMQRRTPPPYDVNCFQTRHTGFNPQITSPRTQLNYVISARTHSSTPIPLTAIADADVATLYWFLNETFLGKTPRDQLFYWTAKPGRYVIRVVDDQGRSDARDVWVKSM
jgi:penicillin-binding protein 1C